MSSTSAPVIRRPRDPISEDEAKEKRKEQNRKAQANARAKKKEAMSAGAKVKPTSLQSIPEIPKKAKMSEEEAKNIINRAVQVDKAKREVNILRYEKIKKEMIASAKSYMEVSKDVVIKDGKIDYVLIDPELRDFKQYVGESYPEVLRIIKKYHSRTLNEKDAYGIKRQADKIYLKFKPYADYDTFTFSYPRSDGTITDFSFKIDYSADRRYATYLYNNYYRYNYYKYQESLGNFERESDDGTITIEDIKDKGLPTWMRYPDIELEQNTDTIKDVPKNKSRIGVREDYYFFFHGEPWHKKTLDRKYSDMFNTQTIKLGKPDPESPKPRPESASANLGRASTSSTMKKSRVSIAKSAKGRLQNTSSLSGNSTISARSNYSADSAMSSSSYASSAMSSSGYASSAMSSSGYDGSGSAMSSLGSTRQRR